jgi:methylated-DNA-[protein]-cysteine S-methyltransferase
VEFDEYFSGRRRDWTVPVHPLVGTEFQRRVWTQLSDIPFGTTMTYGDLAARLGLPGAARAVGGANGANPLPVVVPCHRVVATSSLGGYSGGLDVKSFLLALEGART